MMHVQKNTTGEHDALPSPLPLTFVLSCCDDEERIGHAINRIVGHLHELGIAHELLVVDEGSGDNTLAVAALLRRTVPELETLHAARGTGFVVGAERARGRIVVLGDIRSKSSSLASLGYALGRIDKGLDVVTLSGRFIAFRRSRAKKAIELLHTQKRDTGAIEQRFSKRARSHGLGVLELQPRREGMLAWLRGLVGAPRLSSAARHL